MFPGLLWLGQHLKVTNRIGSIFTVASSAGCDLLPILVGQFIEATPMILMYVQLVGVAVCVLTFTVAYLATNCSVKRS